MEHIPVWLTVVLTFFGVCGVLGSALAGWAVFRGARNRTQLELIVLSNTELQRSVLWERTECDRKMAEMKGEIQFLRDGIVESMAQAISVAIIDHMTNSLTALKRETDTYISQQHTTTTLTEEG
jgi:hypothetical protein